VANLLDLNGKREMDKAKALESALAQIERQFGKGSIMKLGENNPVMEIEATSTGSLGLDIALGIGGLPKGRIVEIYGPESSGKTTLTLHVVAEEQKKGGVCAFVDAEHALDPSYAKKLGVNLDELLISQPDTGEQALEIVDTLVRSGAVSLIVVDSVAALTPKAEIEGDMGDATVGARVNIGAGTITCNYDGANKHRTVIEDDAFIGSDTQLVAPVTVGKGATIGAGTTLTKDAPPDSLTVSRAKQTSITSWQRPVKIKK